MRIVGLVGVIAYGAVGAAVGVNQQRLGLAPDQIDCAYRVELLRDRVVALTERSVQQSLHDPQDDVVSNLIRETQAACASDERHVAALERLWTRLRAHQRVRAQEAEARRELLAL